MSLSLSEVESQDTLPFVVDSTPSTKSKELPKILAPSIEQVDEDPEVLRSLRGQGRYFGVDNDGPDGHSSGVKEAEPKCSNCSQRGHLKKNCPHVICTYCGSMDDHYSQHCPKAIKCSNCSENGHYRSQCPHKWKKVYCTLCNSKKHSRDRCPSIWRVYLLKGNEQEESGTDKKKKKRKRNNDSSIDFEAVFCYNCGLTGHFGDDCDERRSSRVPNDDGSAFSGDNLSYALKTEYFNELSKERINSSRRNNSNSNRYQRNALYDDYNGTENFNYNDYEYDDSIYDDYSSNSSSRNSNRKAKKRRRNENYGSYDDNNRVIQPTRRGNTIQPARDNSNNNNNNNSNNNNNNNNRHPLTFPRSNSSNSGNVNAMEYGLQSSRYGNGGNYNNQNSNAKRHNSFKPFRSGVIKR